MNSNKSASRPTRGRGQMLEINRKKKQYIGMDSGQEPKICQVPVGLHRNSSQIFFQNTNRKNNIRFFINFKFKLNEILR